MTRVLPTGWNVRLFEQCISKVKYTDKQPTKSFLEEGLFPVISQEKEFINGYSNNKDAVFTVKKPVVIFGDHTKNVKYVDFDFVIGADGVKILQPIQEIDSKYFYYYLCNIRLRDLGYARHYKLLKECVVCYPSLPEQKRIVEKLDKIFADIDKAKEYTEKNLENVKELFEVFLDKIFTQGINECEEKSLREICSFNRGLTYKKSDEVPFSSNVVLRANNIDLSTNSLNFDELKYLSPDFEIPADKKVQKDCLLVCTASGSKSHLGKVALIGKDYGYAFGGFMGLLLPNQFIDSHYLFYALISKPYIKFISHLTDGANINNLKWNQLQNFSLPCPTMDEQKRIVAQLDALRAKTQKLEQIYTKKLTDLDELKQSVLQQAFSGKL